MLNLLAFLIITPSQADSTRLPTALRVVVEQALAEVQRDPSLRSTTGVYIDIMSFRGVLGNFESDELAWKQLVLAGGMKGLDRTKEWVWQCSPASQASGPCSPIPKGKILVYAVKQASEGATIKIDLNISWSNWNAVKGQLTPVGTSYEAVLQSTARGWEVKSVKRVPTFTRGGRVNSEW